MKFRVSRNLHNAVSQQLYVEVEEEGGGARRTLPAKADCTYSISASIYNVFYSVIYNSVDLGVLGRT